MNACRLQQHYHVLTADEIGAPVVLACSTFTTYYVCPAWQLKQQAATAQSRAHACGRLTMHHCMCCFNSTVSTVLPAPHIFCVHGQGTREAPLNIVRMVKGPASVCRPQQGPVTVLAQCLVRTAGYICAERSLAGVYACLAHRLLQTGLICLVTLAVAKLDLHVMQAPQLSAVRVRGRCTAWHDMQLPALGGCW